ncbi:hypothetical protein [Sporolactobacillus nakayamae]|uniref:Uncharacterized protein n=1 Tax=Sporolactobacillus nakayamae TaxID=269670 RepID=A0A1I2P228_9BACL|nr:hypothetical protein [Sporolactobacillus nakayamae]SFG10232.1 hypothetical protein SAMN02982927_00679 [Sporolactobacillus nakayamae]
MNICGLVTYYITLNIIWIFILELFFVLISNINASFQSEINNKQLDYLLSNNYSKLVKSIRFEYRFENFTSRFYSPLGNIRRADYDVRSVAESLVSYNSFYEGFKLICYRLNPFRIFNIVIILLSVYLIFGYQFILTWIDFAFNFILKWNNYFPTFLSLIAIFITVVYSSKHGRFIRTKIKIKSSDFDECMMFNKEFSNAVLDSLIFSMSNIDHFMGYRNILINSFTKNNLFEKNYNQLKGLLNDVKNLDELKEIVKENLGHKLKFPFLKVKKNYVCYLLDSKFNSFSAKNIGNDYVVSTIVCDKEYFIKTIDFYIKYNKSMEQFQSSIDQFALSLIRDIVCLKMYLEIITKELQKGNLVSSLFENVFKK